MFKGWKTFLYGLAIALSGVGLDYVAGYDWTSSGMAPWIVSLIGVGVMALRTVTSTSIFKKDPAPDQPTFKSG
jgi:hypothetical protein